MRRLGLRERPDYFVLDRGAPLATGLVFAGLGKFPGSSRYEDSSGYGRHANASTDGAGIDATNWIYNGELRRHGLRIVRNDWLPFGLNGICASYPFSFAAWGGYVTYNDTSFSLLFGASDDTYAECTGIGTRYVFSGGFLYYVAMCALSDYTYYQVTQAFLQNGLFHLAGVFRSATDRELYLNGASVATDNTNKGPPDQNLRIGTDEDNLRDYGGDVYDPMAWNRVLFPSEIQQLADPFNFMLSSLLLPPRRKLWAVSGAAPASIIPRIMHHRRLMQVA